MPDISSRSPMRYAWAESIILHDFCIIVCDSQNEKKNGDEG